MQHECKYGLHAMDNVLMYTEAMKLKHTSRQYKVFCEIWYKKTLDKSQRSPTAKRNFTMTMDWNYVHFLLLPALFALLLGAVVLGLLELDKNPP